MGEEDRADPLKERLSKRALGTLLSCKMMDPEVDRLETGSVRS